MEVINLEAMIKGVKVDKGMNTEEQGAAKDCTWGDGREKKKPVS